MTPSTAERLRELLEEAREQWRIGDLIQADAKRQYEEARLQRQEIFALIRAEQERRSRPFWTRFREAFSSK
jgi:hypothetical protein